MSIEQLLERIHILWMAGDEGMLSDYRDLTEDELREQYQWVESLPQDLINFLWREVSCLHLKDELPIRQENGRSGCSAFLALSGGE